jgi:hypothetical protein
MINVSGTLLKFMNSSTKMTASVSGTTTLQARPHAQHVFILAGPFEAIACGQHSGILDFFRNGALGVLDVAADIAASHVHIDPASERTILVLD